VCGLPSEAAPLEVVISTRVNQQPPMHQLAVLSTGWAKSFHSVPDGVHHNPFFSFWLLIVVRFYFYFTLRLFTPWT
jgi:hypothetical protein